jgi:pyruvyl transferase EpsO
MTLPSETLQDSRTLHFASLQREILSVLGNLVSRYRSCALVDFPNHWNTGDNAIWLGELLALKRLGIRIDYVCDTATYRSDALRRAIGNQVVLFHGGGNFGNLYPRHQRLREQILEDFPDNEIIQLPQTIWFTSDGESDLQRARFALARHRRVTILVRDLVSLEFARRTFDATVLLCPDMALGLEPRQPSNETIFDVVILGRTDKEARSEWKDSEHSSLNITLLDWIGVPWGLGAASSWVATWEKIMARPTPWIARAQRRIPVPLLRGPQSYLAHRWNSMAMSRVRDGMALLSSGKTVVTDRLHAHIFCALLGMPHVVLDNNYGKVRAVHDAWTSKLGLAKWARTQQEALEIAAEIVGHRPQSDPHKRGNHVLRRTPVDGEFHTGSNDNLTR